MMKSKQLHNQTSEPAPQQNNKLASRQRQLIAAVLPILPGLPGVPLAIKTGSQNIEGELKQDIIKRKMKARLKERLGIEP